MSLRRTFSSTAVVAALVVPVTLALPVVSAPAATPHPVKAHVTTIALGGPGAASVRTSGLPASASATPAAATGRTPRLAVLTAERTVAPYRLVGLTWTGPAPLVMQVRVRTNGVWHDWQSLAAGEDGPDATSAEGKRVKQVTTPLLVPGSDGVQVRVDTADGKVPADLDLNLIDPGDSPADAAIPSAPASSASAAQAQPVIVTRAQWGADESLRDPAFKYTSTVKVGFVHHSASPNSYWSTSGWTMADAAKDIRSIYAYYTGSAGFADIPYNFFVDMAGRIYEGRAGGVDKAVLGAHTGGFNTDTFAVAALGNLEIARPSSALVASIGKVMAWKLGLFHRNPLGSTVLTSTGGGTSRYAAGVQVTVPNLAGHRDVGATLCPGGYLYPYLPSIRAAAVAWQGPSFYNPVASSALLDPANHVPLVISTATSGALDWTATVIDSHAVAVRTIHGHATSASALAVSWNLLDDAGAVVAPGAFTVTLTGGTTAGSAVPFSTSLLVGAANVPATTPLDPVEWQPGYRLVGTRDWYTSCALLTLDLKRCTVMIKATTVSRVGGVFVKHFGWVVNNYTYIAYDAPAWSSTVIAGPGNHVSGTRLYRTDCSPSVNTGQRTCHSYIWASVIASIPNGHGGYTYQVRNLWLLNSMAYLATPPVVAP